MSRKTGRKRRLQLFDRGNIVCPICMTRFTRDQASSGRAVTLEHVPAKALGGQPRCLTCRACNQETGRAFDQAAASAAQERFPVTIDILGKRDTFMLSLEGKALTSPFRGYSEQDWEKLDNSPSRQFTMSLKIVDRALVALSALKAAYLALFSLLGPRDGYEYVRGTALAPVRHLIAERLRRDAIQRYVWEVHEGTPDTDVLLISQPVPCWVVKIGSQLVNLPLAGHSPISAPLWERRRLHGGDSVLISGRASWLFHTFGALRTVHVHLASADKVESLLGLTVSGTLPNGQHLKGTCVRHTGESAILLCTGAGPSGRRSPS